MLRLLITFALVLTGCTTANEFYSPVVKRSERLSIGSCGTSFDSFVRKVGSGVYLEIFDQTIIFRAKKGMAIKLEEKDVAFLSGESKEVSRLEVREITTGTFPTEAESKYYGLKPMKFSPVEEFISSGQYANIDMKWGEWSPWKSKEDVFHVVLSGKPAIKPKESYSIAIPRFFINGKLTEVEPIVFKWKTQSSLMCVQ